MAPNGGGVTLSYENEDIGSLPSFEKKGYRTVPILYVNGSRIEDKDAVLARPGQTLLSYLRDVLGLSGTKLGCAEGGCGACTVMISRYDPTTAKIQHYSANACLMPVLAADGCHVTTVEGVGSVRDGLHPVQSAMVDMHGSQCGFCTPGIIVAIYSLLAQNPTRAYMEEHLDGNLCRCTGYRPIWDASRSLCVDAGDEPVGPCGTPCRECPERETCTLDCNVADGGGGGGAASEEEKKVDAPADAQKKNGVVGTKDGVCCTSSSDKMKAYLSTLPAEADGGPSGTWLEQPNEMFPDELKSTETDVAAEAAKPLVVMDKSAPRGATWFKPASLVELLGLLRQYEGGCKIVVGNTEVGIETKFKQAFYPRLIYPSHSIESLYNVSFAQDSIQIGACAPLSSIQHECERVAETTDNVALKRIAEPIKNMLRWFASSQIRNVACLGGNLVTASPISDMNPMLACMGANLVLASVDSEGVVTRRRVAVSDFFLRYRIVDLQPTELVESIEIPIIQQSLEYISPFKQARRREDDISIVTSGMRAVIAPDPSGSGSYIIKDASMAFGGMAPTTVMTPKTAEALVGQVLDADTFRSAAQVLMDELYLPEAVPGGQVEYRRALASSYLYQFYLYIVSELELDVKSSSSALPPAPSVSDDERSGAESFLCSAKPSVGGVQKYPAPKVAIGLEGGGRSARNPPTETIAKAALEKDAVGKASHHASGPLHCTGEALYVDDIPLPPATLHAQLVLASKCNVELKSIDASPALSIPGVVDVYTHKDLEKLGGSNILGPVKKDEVCFLPVGEKAVFVGQVIGVCVAESLEAAELGAKNVAAEYGDATDEPIVTIEQAIAANCYYDYAKETIERGAVDDVFSQGADTGTSGKLVTVAGTFRNGGQEHFYLETNATLAVPSESATNLTIYASTQAPTKTQNYCASATNTPSAKVVVRMKRMGGGFGGKETRSAFSSCAAAVAAKISNRPVRLTMPRDVDMSITGGRHTFLTKYRAAARVTSDGQVKLEALDAQLYNNGGSAFDLSGPVLCRALFHIDGCYNWPHFRAVGQVCKTAQPPHTAFRGFGGPQGIAACEHVMEHLALACNVPSDELRRENMYLNTHSTPFGTILGNELKWNVPTMWDKLQSELNIPARRQAVDAFNAKNKWKKRGLAYVPTKFGIAFTEKLMNQGGALVHVYTDGTVLVSHGGTEMGQGLHTKVCQVAAQAFDIPLEDVYINDTSTDKVANTMPTAASMSTDMYGMATFDACSQILDRLKPYREKLGSDAKLSEVALAAHFSRVNLSAQGFFTLMDKRCGFDFKKEKPADYPSDAPVNSWKGQPFNYFTQGVACSEVEIDVLSGNHRVISSDVVVDVGSSINPTIDIGQIEGAFIQGMGWSTMEEVVFADSDHTWIRPTGKVFTSGPGTYKIPAFNDVPETFNVSLMKDVDNPFAVHSSKAIGEPPFFLGASVFFAIRDAISAARSQNLKRNEYFDLDMPGTSERIRMACADEIALECIAKSGKTISDFRPKGSY